MNNRLIALALAGSLASALSSVAAPASAADGSKEKCYGIALKGQNDCAAGKHSCAGMSKTNYDKTSFKLVPAGTCHAIKGSLKSA